MVRMLSGNDNIDASVGLAFSLELFRRYRRTGLLRAEIHHVPGIPGPCKAYIHLIDGFVSSCTIINKRGQRIPSHQTILCRVDDERGPFEWRFQATSTSPTPSSSSPISGATARYNEASTIGETKERLNVVGQRKEKDAVPRFAIDDFSVPRILSYPQWNMLYAWSPAQKRMLYEILTTIDGTRTIQEIKMTSPLSDSLVEDALRVLLKLKVIALG